MEQVLCIERQRLPRAWVSQRAVVPMDLDTFLIQCIKSRFAFIDRSKAEQDNTQKQIIPYILLQTDSGDQTAVYLRKGSEKRLHDLWSAGIGGHINPVDSNGSPQDFKGILMAGMMRELDEELACRPDSDLAEFLGVISEEMTPVGSVHLGAVFRIRTRTPDAFEPGPELYRFQWKPTPELAQLNLELWSELAMELADSR